MSLINNLKTGFLRMFGDIKVFKWPMFILYDPGSYKVKGEDMREVIKIIEPGDMLVRGYDNYVDGYFIPGYFSHAGLYIGKVTEDDKKIIKTKKGEKNFKTGDQMIIHSMAEGVFMEDILNFCRCDEMAIVRFPKQFTATKKLSTKDVPFDQFNEKEKEYFNKLNNNEVISYTEVFKTIFELALQQLGKKYDFNFNFKNYNDLSCTEFVYFCIKSLEGFHGLKPKERKVFMFDKTMIIPDAFMEVNFQKVWQSKSVKKDFI
jgi:Orthopoxvirus protein of unknown function (DUF830).